MLKKLFIAVFILLIVIASIVAEKEGGENSVDSASIAAGVLVAIENIQAIDLAEQYRLYGDR